MPNRVFKTAWFSKAAMKARINDAELCSAIRQVELGQADDLGGGVFKKRLNDNRHRSIILAKSGEFWVFTFLFAKKDRANIDNAELQSFRSLAAVFRAKPQTEIQLELRDGGLKEICHDKKTKI
jgi:hypothetical protein